MATITVQDLAQELGTDARTTRKFLRSVTEKDSQPGKGSKWAIEKREIRSLRSKFKAFSEAQRPRTEKADPIDDDAELVQDFKDLMGDDAEPTAEQLDELEALNDED